MGLLLPFTKYTWPSLLRYCLFCDITTIPDIDATESRLLLRAFSCIILFIGKGTSTALLVIFRCTCCILSCLVCIVVSCLVCVVVVVLCVLLSSYVYLLYYVCTAVFTLDAGLLARSQYSEGPATGHLDTGFS